MLQIALNIFYFNFETLMIQFQEEIMQTAG